MKAFRRHATYANVVSTIALFLVLSGATAFAAKELARTPVGTPQLKPLAVTAAKIRDGAVTDAKLAEGSVTSGKIANGSVTGGKLADGSVAGGKLADGAVTGGKLADGSVTSGKIANGSVTADKLDQALITPPHVTNRLVGTQQAAFPTTFTLVPYALDNPTFTQPAGEDELYIGEITARFSAGCKAPREFSALLQESDPGAFGGKRLLGSAFGEDHGTGEATVTATFGASAARAMTTLGSSTPTSHTLSISLERIFCATGSTAGATATATGARVDVIGIR